MSAKFHRVSETDRASVAFSLDEVSLTALEGDTVLTAIMSNGGFLRISEFDKQKRAGFCLMGACNDCVVWTEGADKLRACSTVVTPGLRLFTRLPEDAWPKILT